MFKSIPPIIKLLLAINVGVFLLQSLLRGSPLLESLMLWPLGSGDTDPYGAVQGFMPWQLLTYGFLHDGVMHILFNMLTLVMFGAPLAYTWGEKRFLQYYLACIVGAGICQLAVGWWTMSQGGMAYPTLGASGGTLGLVLAYGLLFPQQKIMIFPIPFFIPARIGVLLIGGMAVFAGMTGTMPTVAHFAHLGGMLTGWLLIRHWRKPPTKPKPPRHLRSV